MVRTLVVFSIASWLGNAHALLPCPNRPCHGTPEVCAANASWVLEGIYQGKNSTESELAQASLLRGSYPIANGVAVVSNASHCWAALPTLEAQSAAIVGRKVRVYGIDRGSKFGGNAFVKNAGGSFTSKCLS